MPVSESILVAIFTMSVVFAVLVLLWAIIRVFSFFINKIEKGHAAKITNHNN